jgi:hypothetical protein
MQLCMRECWRTLAELSVKGGACNGVRGSSMCPSSGVSPDRRLILILIRLFLRVDLRASGPINPIGCIGPCLRWTWYDPWAVREPELFSEFVWSDELPPPNILIRPTADAFRILLGYRAR